MMRRTWLPALSVLFLPAYPARGADVEPSWPPAKHAARLKENPKSELDGEIKSLIADYERRIAALDAGDAVVRMNLPRLRENLTLLYKEYNRDKRRYRSDHFSPKQCIDYLKHDVKFYLADSLEKGKDPYSWVQGRWAGKAFWLERTRIMGRYDLVVPKGYDPKRSWPLIFSYQDSPSVEQMRTVPYFMVRNIQRGYPKGMVALEDKTRSILKDVARDFDIDPFRIYATGFSFGGHTDLVQAWRHPHWFAAIAPVCNDLRGKNASLVKHIRNTPALLLHGTGDSFLNTGQKIHAFMKEAGCSVRWKTYPGGHDPGVPFRKDVRMLTDFFDEHVLDPYPKTVHHIVEHKRYSRAFWVDAKLVEDRGGLAAVFDVSVGEGNRIEVNASEEIAELDLHLNELVVAMDRPVTVVSAGRKLYEGRPGEKLTIRLREGREYYREAREPLWKQILGIRMATRP